MSNNRKKIKIVVVSTASDNNTDFGKADAEKTLEDLVNQGWEIVTAGGGTGQYGTVGFVVLQLN